MERERLTKREVVTELNGAQVKPLSNNTFEVNYSNGNRAIRYHHTDIITYHSNGDIILNTNGWLTNTTKERFGFLKGYRIIQDNKVWYIAKSPNGSWPSKGTWIPFKDGMTIHPDGTIEGASEDPKVLLKLDKSITKYIEGYIKALFDGKINKPGSGDCWGCLMKDVTTGKTVMGNDHLLSHFQERYYVPSLLMNAIEVFPVSIIAKQTIGFYLKYHDQDCSMFQEITKSQVKSSLRRYLRRQLGMAA